MPQYQLHCIIGITKSTSLGYVDKLWQHVACRFQKHFLIRHKNYVNLILKVKTCPLEIFSKKFLEKSSIGRQMEKDILYRSILKSNKSDARKPFFTRNLIRISLLWFSFLLRRRDDPRYPKIVILQPALLGCQHQGLKALSNSLNISLFRSSMGSDEYIIGWYFRSLLIAINVTTCDITRIETYSEARAAVLLFILLRLLRKRYHQEVFVLKDNYVLTMSLNLLDLLHLV